MHFLFLLFFPSLFLKGTVELGKSALTQRIPLLYVSLTLVPSWRSCVHGDKQSEQFPPADKGSWESDLKYASLDFFFLTKSFLLGIYCNLCQE